MTKEFTVEELEVAFWNFVVDYVVRADEDKDTVMLNTLISQFNKMWDVGRTDVNLHSVITSSFSGADFIGIDGHRNYYIEIPSLKRMLYDKLHDLDAATAFVLRHIKS